MDARPLPRPPRPPFDRARVIFRILAGVIGTQLLIYSLAAGVCGPRALEGRTIGQICPGTLEQLQGGFDSTLKLLLALLGGAATGPIPAEAWPQAGPQTGEARSKPSSRSQALPVHPRQRCPTQKRQQQLEGGIKAALQLLQRAGADLPDRSPLQRPLAADPGSKGIDQQLGADHHRQDLEHKPLAV
ncbi:MAG: hypothetical protein ACKOPS_13745, partial [Cyanobium sp.]